jgi:hypothetical protein
MYVRDSLSFMGKLKVFLDKKKSIKGSKRKYRIYPNIG